ncbi:unconventional myosin-X isoform X2 [Hydra vulgaris]|uniref:Unconventional myosin-X isoform X2 n=1 Tax=Hydra vulgaris TaxID=6087 RepID=A0ABM4CSU3_HYDVU
MKVIGLSNEQISNIHYVLSSILQLGNITFIPTGGAQISNKNELERLSTLLQIDIYLLNDALTQKSMNLRGEEIFSPLSVEQAVDARDSVAMALFQACFKWIIHNINLRLKGDQTFSSIGILDIFGFENFQINRFEQFNINFANEKLQEYFNKHIFSLEQLEYNREGLEWTDIDWNDNGECLDLVEKKLGILSLIDEESHFPKGTDESLLKKLHENLANNVFYIKPRVANSKFGIKHYAGEVFYDCVGFLEKNRDTFRDDLLRTIKESRSDFVYDLFEKWKSEDLSSNTKNALNKKPRKPTVSSQFKDSLFSLMLNLNSANPYFVRCIKPNNVKTKDLFDEEIVLNQLKYSGMLETVKIRKAGFPVRRLYEDFMRRYRALFYKIKFKMLVDAKDNCILILTQFDPCRELHRIGKTKIFLKDKLESEIEIHRTKNINYACAVILNQLVGYQTRKKFLKIKLSVLVIQKYYKAHYYHKKFVNIKKATLMIQKFERGRQARKLYANMLEQKRIEEERLRELERLREEEHLREMEKLEQERKLHELAEMKIKREEEERIRMEQEEEKRIKDEQQRQAELAKLKVLEENRRALEEQKRQEEEARIREEIKKRLEQEEAKKLKEETEAQELQNELERQDRKATEDALREMAELDAQLQIEEALDEEEDIDDDTVARMMNFNEDTSVVDLVTYEGYLSLKGGIIANAKKHWCVLKDDTLMWFRRKQKALKSGWLLKKGGGSGTLSRRNWKKRWFILKDTLLTYHENDQEGAKVLGTIDLRSCRQIVDSNQKENAFSLVMPSRTYHFVSENPQEWDDWFRILNRVHRANDSELRLMKEESANVKNAVGTIETIIIESISVDLIEEKSQGFSIITANRVYSFVAEKSEEVENWVKVLEKSKEKQLEEGTSVAIEKGWLLKLALKEQARDKRRWFVLNNNSLDYFKSPENNSSRLGSILLNSLCTVIPPPPPDDIKSKETGRWEFVVNGRKRSYNLVCPSHEQAVHWQVAIQEVIENKPPVETPFQKLMNEIMNSKSESLINRIYRVNPLLTFTKQPLKMPLLPLPYGHSLALKAQNKGYGTFYEEALKIFKCLQELENVADPIAVTQGILQTCHDLNQLRDEVYCQLIKQTSGLIDPDNISALRHMQVLVCMSCTFLPSRKVLRFLLAHLKRVYDEFTNSEIAKFSEFAADALKRTRVREYPPSRGEIITLLGRRKINVLVHCYGGGSCQISIDSSITSGEVVKILCKGMGIVQDNLTFGLFEKCGPHNERSIEDREIVADIISKFEKFKALEVNKNSHNKWILFFKIFCYLHPHQVSSSSVEGLFLYEQTCEYVMRGRYLFPELTLCKLAALRLQYLEGDCIVGTWIDKEISTIFPVGKIRSKAAQEKKPTPKKDYGTIRGTISKAISSFKGEEDIEERSEQPVYDVEEELSAIKSSIMAKWKELKGTDPDDALVEYMSIVKNWYGFGSTMFNVKSKEAGYPPNLFLGVGYKNVALYRRDETRPIQTYNYEEISSFGAPKSNVYRIILEGRSPIQFETEMVLEIAKLMKAYINEIVKKTLQNNEVLRDTLKLIEN